MEQEKVLIDKSLVIRCIGLVTQEINNQVDNPACGGEAAQHLYHIQAELWKVLGRE